MESHDSSVRDIVRIIFKRKSLCLFIVIASLAMAYGALMFVTPTYKSEAKLLISGLPQVESPYYTAITPMRAVDVASTVSEVITSRDLLREVVVALGLDKRTDADEFTPAAKKYALALYEKYGKNIVSFFYRVKQTNQDEDYRRIEKAINTLAKNIQVDSIERTDVIKMTVLDYNPAMAAKIADALTKRYITFNMERQILDYMTKFGSKHPRVLQLKDELKEVRSGLVNNTIGIDEIMSRGNVKVVEQAAVPVKAFIPNRMATYVVALVLALVLGVASMFIAEMLDHSIKSASDIERYIKLPVVTSIRYSGSMRSMGKKKFLETDAPHRRAYEIFMGQLYLLLKEKGPISLAVASVGKKEGKTTVASDIASLLSMKGHIRTLLIDANLDAPAIHTMLGQPTRFGLMDVLSGTVRLRDAAEPVNETLWVIADGKPHTDPEKYFKEDAIHRFIEESKKSFDAIIFDGAPLINSTWEFLLCKHADASLLVVKEGYTRREVIRNTLSKIENGKIVFLGVVLNQRREYIPAFIYNHV